MKPAPGHYRLSAPGAPDMDVFVSMVGLTSTLDTFDYLPEHDLFKARRLTCAIECTGMGTFLAFVGPSPGFSIAGTCVKIG